MAATIIQFPQTHSNIFLNLTQLINLASDNQAVEEYAEIMAVCHEEGNFKPGEVETLQEQIRARRLENASRQRFQKSRGCTATLRRWENRSQSVRSKQSGAITADITTSTLRWS